jgi:AraC-like DNA-binding protein
MNNAFQVHPGFTAKEYQEQCSICREFFDSTVHEHRGRKTEVDVSGYSASFRSVTDAVHSAMEIFKRFDDLDSRTSGVTIRPGIGIGAGEPVSRRDDLFGEVIQEAVRLCMAASGGYAVVSSGVKEQYRKENLGSFPATGILLSPDPAGEDLFNRFMDAIEENWDSENVSLAYLCRLTGTSRAQLYRKIKALTGRSAAGFLRNYRLDRARELLENRQGSVSQIAFASGFSNPSYFSKCFRKRFGVLPSAYGTLYA